MKNCKGSITVMLILVLCSIIMAVAVLVEGARIKIAEGQAKRAVDTALFSALSVYDQDLKDEYGLFYRYGMESLNQEIQEDVKKTLLMSDGSSEWNPYEFKIKSMDIRILYPLNNKDSIKHQILEHMKYRGPEKLVGQVMEKLSAFFSVQPTAKVLKADLLVDQKVRRLAELMRSMDSTAAIVSGYSNQNLRTFNESAMELAEKAMQIDAQQNDIGESGEILLLDIVPVLEANREMLRICHELKKIGPDIEGAISRSESMIDQEKNVITNVRDSLKVKYEMYNGYIKTQDLNSIENDLQSNIRLIEPKIDLMMDLIAGDSSGYRPQAYIEDGYRSPIFKPQINQSSPSKTRNYNFNLTPEAVSRLMSKVSSYIEEVKNSATVDESSSVMNCPGSQLSSNQKNVISTAGDDNNGAADLLSSIYDSIEADVNSGSLVESASNGTLKLSADVYESLLINEYVLSTFNNREDRGHDKHALKQTEVEYVLIGSENPQVNASLSQLEIIAWRTVFNSISFGYYCPEIINAVNDASIGLAALTGVPCPVWKGVLAGLMAIIESYLDTNRMIKGEQILQVKFNLSDTSMAKDCQELLSEFGICGSESAPDSQKRVNQDIEPENMGIPTDSGKMTRGKEIYVDYEDHLRAMLLYRSMLGQGDTILSRIQDLIFTSIQEIRGEYDPFKHFNFIEVDAQFTIKSFFPNLSGINTRVKGIPMQHTILVECGRGY